MKDIYAQQIYPKHEEGVNVKLYGFVASAEETDGLETFQLEMVMAEWIDNYLKKTNAKELISEVFANTTAEYFEERFNQIKVEDLRRLHGIHLDFLLCLLKESPLVSLMQVMLEPEHGFVEGSWYLLNFERDKELISPLEMDVKRHFNAVFSELSDPFNEPIWSIKNLEWSKLDDDFQIVLHALHYPMIFPTERCCKMRGPIPPSVEKNEILPKIWGYGPFSSLSKALNFSRRHCRFGYSEGIRTRLFKHSDLWWVTTYPADTSGYAFEAWVQDNYPHLRFIAPSRFPNNPLESYTESSLPFVGVYAVGQASCTGVYDNCEDLISYLDFGAPLPWFRDSIPASSASPSVLSDPLIILSHWDYDHYAMSRRVPESYQMRWIVPQQTIGPVAAKELYARIVFDISGGGRLYLWPNGKYRQGILGLQWGFITRCTGRRNNDSGLATFACFEGLQRQDCPSMRGPHCVQEAKQMIPQTPFLGYVGACELRGIVNESNILNSEYKAVLYPGDASLSSIPRITETDALIGIVASHHGGEHQCKVIPSPQRLKKCPVAFSYGTYPASQVSSQHCYKNKAGEGLPREIACRAYREAGWNHRLNTAPEAHLSTQPDLLEKNRNPTGYQSIGNAALGWDRKAKDGITMDIRQGVPQSAGSPIERLDHSMKVSRQFQF